MNWKSMLLGAVALSVGCASAEDRLVGEWEWRPFYQPQTDPYFITFEADGGLHVDPPESCDLYT